MAGSCSVSNFYDSVRPRYQPVTKKKRRQSGTYHVNDRTDNLMNLSNSCGLGGHVASPENRKGGPGGLEGIAESGSPEIGADPPSGSKSGNPAVRVDKRIDQFEWG